MSDVLDGASAPVIPASPATPAPGAQPVIAPDAPAGQDQAQPPEGQEPAKPRTYTEEEHRKGISERLKKESRRLERIARAEAERDYYKSLVERGQPKAEAAPKKDEAPQPKDYPDFESWQDAKIEWKARQILAEERDKSQRESDEDRTAREESERVTKLAQNVLAGAKKYPDFREVVDESDSPITRTMALAISESKFAADLAYHLSKNSEEAERIAALPASLQAHEVHMLAQKLAVPPAPTKAPAPIVPNNSNASPSKDWKEMSTKEHVDAWLKRPKR